MPSLTKALLALTSLLSLAAAQNLYIQNNCGSDIYVDDVCGTGDSPQTVGAGQTVSIQAPGGEGGNYACSAKVSPDGSTSNILQFEYSLGYDGNLWYDLSAQNGDPFLNQWRGVTTGNGDSGSSSCPGDIACQPGDDSCAFVGNNAAGPTYFCNTATDIWMWVC